MKHPYGVTGALLLLLLVSVAAGVGIGSAHVDILDAYRVLLARLFGLDSHLDPTVDRIVWSLRLPRVVLALIVGGGLGVVGAAMQALVRNPLAEPYILGISGGAAAGASLFYLGLLPAVISQMITMPLAAFAGGLLSITIVYLVASSGSHISVARLLLAGVAMSALMGAITALATFASPEPNKLRAILFWLQGSFSGSRWEMIAVPGAITTAGLVVLVGISRELDALLVGEESAQTLGVPTETIKRILIVLAALITGALVSTSGAIGFVGLIVPHVVRFFTGVSHRRVIPLCFLAGAVFLVWADILARTLIPAQELPVGAVTAFCGVPFFLALLRRRRYQFG